MENARNTVLVKTLIVNLATQLKLYANSANLTIISILNTIAFIAPLIIANHVRKYNHLNLKVLNAFYVIQVIM